MVEITAVNGISLTDPSIDLSQGFPPFYRRWLKVNNVEHPTKTDFQKAEQEYSLLDENIQREWCGIEASVQRNKLSLTDEEIRILTDYEIGKRKP